jgi:hypothetical protein
VALEEVRREVALGEGDWDWRIDSVGCWRNGLVCLLSVTAFSIPIPRGMTPGLVYGGSRVEFGARGRCLGLFLEWMWDEKLWENESGLVWRGGVREALGVLLFVAVCLRDCIIYIVYSAFRSVNISKPALHRVCQTA